MFCEKCGGELRQDGNKLICQKCGAEYGLDYSDGYNADYSAGGEKVAPRGFASKKYIIIIVIAAILVLGGIGTGIAIGASNHTSQSALSGFELAEKYLSEQNYEQAIIAFEQLIEIEPMNVDAYLGLADAYLGIGNKDKAIEVLRRGLDFTGDSRIREKLDGLTKVEDNSSVSDNSEPDNSASEDSSQLKLVWTEIDSNAVGKGFGNFMKKDGELWRFCDDKGHFVSDKKYKYVENFAGTSDANYSIVQTEDARAFCVDKNYNELFELENYDGYAISDQENPLIVSWHIKEWNNDNDKSTLRIYSVKGDLLYKWNENESLDGSGKPVSINDPVIPESAKVYSGCDDKYHFDHYCESIKTTIQQYDTVSVVGSKLYIPFQIELSFDWDREKEEAAREAAREENLQNGGTIWSEGYGSAVHNNLVRVVYEFSYENGKLNIKSNKLLESSETNSADLGYSILREGEDYCLVNYNNPTPNAYFLLKTPSSSKMMICKSDFPREYDVTNTNFDFVVGFISDKLMVCGRYTDDTGNRAQYALFEANWEDDISDEEIRSNDKILNGKYKRLSDYFDGFGYNENDINLGYCLVSEGSKWGYISLETCGIVAMFDDASNFSNGYAIVTSDGKGHLVDADLNAISEEFPCDGASAFGDGSFRVSVGDTVKRLVIEK